MNLNTMETCLIAAGKNLTGIVGNRDNKFHPGSTEINTITNVSKVNLGQLTKVQVEKKMDMLGDAKVKDSSRSRPTSSRVEGHDMEPMSWNAFGPELIGELLHRFKPRAVTLYCANDPLELLPMFEQKIPVIAYCCFVSVSADFWLVNGFNISNKILVTLGVGYGPFKFRVGNHKTDFVDNFVLIFLAP